MGRSSASPKSPRRRGIEGRGSNGRVRRTGRTGSAVADDQRARTGLTTSTDRSGDTLWPAREASSWARPRGERGATAPVAGAAAVLSNGPPGRAGSRARESRFPAARHTGRARTAGAVRPSPPGRNRIYRRARRRGRALRTPRARRSSDARAPRRAPPRGRRKARAGPREPSRKDVWLVSVGSAWRSRHSVTAAGSSVNARRLSVPGPSVAPRHRARQTCRCSPG